MSERANRRRGMGEDVEAAADDRAASKDGGGEDEDAGVTTADTEADGSEAGLEAEADADDEMGLADTPGHIDEVAAPAVELDPEQELEELRDRHLRLAAEFDNFRRRTRRELLETGERGRADLARRLLDVIDDLQRVADTPAEGTTTQALHEGVELVSRKLAKTLADAGVEPVNPVGERFDPNLHEALFITPTGDPERDETVSEVILVGYRLGERLLRPAQVGVFRYEEESA